MSQYIRQSTGQQLEIYLLAMGKQKLESLAVGMRCNVGIWAKRLPKLVPALFDKDNGSGKLIPVFNDLRNQSLQ